MPDYSEYIQIINNKIEYRNHVKGDDTFMCDIVWGEKEAKRIIQNQNIETEHKVDNPFSRIIINHDSKEVYIQIGVLENKNGSGVLLLIRFIDILNQTWEGWSVKRVNNGFYGVVKYLSKYDNKIKYSTNKHTPNYLKDLWDEPKGALISIMTNNETIYEYKDVNIAEIISQGENILSNHLTNVIPNNKIPFGGIHINKTTKEVMVWNVIESEQLDKWTSQYWKNWNIKSYENGLIKHFKMIEKEKKLKSIAAELENEICQILKSEILNAKHEPYSENGHKFKPRQMLREDMEEELKKLIEQTKNNYL